MESSASGSQHRLPSFMFAVVRFSGVAGVRRGPALRTRIWHRWHKLCLMRRTQHGHTLESLPPFDRDGNLQVIVETPKGSRNKFKYKAKKKLFMLSSMLPLRASFPFDFGFVPC